MEAFEPLGSSVAGAIVCASLFFVAGVLGLAYFFYTSETGRRLKVIVAARRIPLALSKKI